MESEQLHMISPTTLFDENPKTYIPEIILKHLAFLLTEDKQAEYLWHYEISLGLIITKSQSPDDVTIITR